jgi:hypothetical protein
VGEKGVPKTKQKTPEKSPEKPTQKTAEKPTEKAASGQRRGRQRRTKAQAPTSAEAPGSNPAPVVAAATETGATETGAHTPADRTFYLPQVGVEIVDSEERSGIVYHTIRDLRNGHTIHNVTRKGARKLWSYAIERCEDHPLNVEAIAWHGDVGMIRKELRAGKLRYDLALREDGKVRVFYGVTEDGMEGEWAQFL